MLKVDQSFSDFWAILKMCCKHFLGNFWTNFSSYIFPISGGRYIWLPKTDGLFLIFRFLRRQTTPRSLTTKHWKRPGGTNTINLLCCNCTGTRLWDVIWGTYLMYFWCLILFAWLWLLLYSILQLDIFSLEPMLAQMKSSLETVWPDGYIIFQYLATYNIERLPNTE